MKYRGILIALLTASSVSAVAQGLELKPLIGMRAQFGGDTLGTIYYTDGSDQKLKAGQGLEFYGGAILKSMPYAIKASIGFKYSSSQASNLDVEKTAWPLIMTGRFYPNNDFYLGAGFTQHLNPKLSIDSTTAEYDASLGYHFEAGWKWISLGWTSMNYAYNGNDFDASSFDINLEYVF
jgi:hypothetical protein